MDVERQKRHATVSFRWSTLALSADTIATLRHANTQNVITFHKTEEISITGSRVILPWPYLRRAMEIADQRPVILFLNLMKFGRVYADDDKVTIIR